MRKSKRRNGNRADRALAELADLEKQGVITEAEFEPQEAKILARVDQPGPSSDQWCYTRCRDLRPAAHRPRHHARADPPHRVHPHPALQKRYPKGAAFIFGWLLSLAIVVALTVLVTGNKPPKPKTAPSLAALAVKIAIGVALLLIALRQRRRWLRSPKKPRGGNGLDDMLPPAAGLALSPNLGLWRTGIHVITRRADIVGSYGALFLLCFGRDSVCIGLGLWAFAGRRPRILGRIRTWIDTIPTR